MCTSHINLVGLYPVVLQLMRLNCVQQASMRIRLIHIRSLEGSTFVLRYTAIWGGLCIHWALPRISSSMYITVHSHLVQIDR